MKALDEHILIILFGLLRKRVHFVACFKIYLVGETDLCQSVYFAANKYILSLGVIRHKRLIEDIFESFFYVCPTKSSHERKV